MLETEKCTKIFLSFSLNSRSIIMNLSLTQDPQKAKEFFEKKMAFTTGPVEVSGMLKKNAKIQVVDVRAAEDYKKGHVPGAINLPSNEWEKAAEKLDKEKTNIIYCYSQVCHLAAKAAVKFAEQGFPVMEMEGGFKTWTEHKLETEK
ncbi:rhodanese-like domain-containing protein [Coxiella burnetii]|uniref:rhodanese-like domain-containing protein n=1 Tax=Coxiella burnetii TaxID=777 RepID=UPI000593CAA9|nr:rhodanese-like domain-containing protein [Coxiella burnetii]ATN81999.1 rhodanese [Coxiella burnetii]ATN83901.1 rhodanese [Coxiella burnetii]POZ79349.1 rhodanese-like domain-containing protein [Coxiella burnetii]